MNLITEWKIINLNMNNYKLYTFLGDDFFSVAKKAKEIASSENFKFDAVEFEFNSIICFVNKETNLEYLYRDYSNSSLMGWKTAGPIIFEKYPPEIEAELNVRKEEQVTKFNNTGIVIWGQKTLQVQNPVLNKFHVKRLINELITKWNIINRK